MAQGGLKCVSILVLMDLCIKTVIDGYSIFFSTFCFNPCFNGSMYKNTAVLTNFWIDGLRFNPCFNGSMYKNYIIAWKPNKPHEMFQSLF